MKELRYVIRLLCQTKKKLANFSSSGYFCSLVEFFIIITFIESSGTLLDFYDATVVRSYLIVWQANGTLNLAKHLRYKQ